MSGITRENDNFNGYEINDRKEYADMSPRVKTLRRWSTLNAEQNLAENGRLKGSDFYREKERERL